LGGGGGGLEGELLPDGGVEGGGGLEGGDVPGGGVEGGGGTWVGTLTSDDWGLLLLLVCACEEVGIFTREGCS